MKLQRLILARMFAFPDVVDLPVGQIGEGLIAVCGDNGRGKSALLEVVPGANWQSLPARENDHPIHYATARDSRLEYWFETDDGDTYRVLLSLDGVATKPSTDGLLERIHPDGRHEPLNNGQVSTLARAIAALFPSYDLFINSSFAAQGRGDEFARTKPSKRKDLFAEFLGLSDLLTKAETAGKAADLVHLTRERTRATAGALEAELHPDTTDAALDARADALAGRRRAAEARRGPVDVQIAEIEARLATRADAVAAHASATARVSRASADRERLDAVLADLDARRQRADREAQAEAAKRDDVRTLTLQMLDGKIASNQQVLANAAAIRSAVEALKLLETEISQARQDLEAERAAQAETSRLLRDVERQLAALLPVEQRHARATSDAGLLAGVPCGGAGEFAACQFLVNAIAAQGQIETLAGQLATKAGLADQVGALTKRDHEHVTVIRRQQQLVADLTGRKPTLKEWADYEPALLEAEHKIEGYQRERDRVIADADARGLESRQRYAATIDDLVTRRGAAAAERETLDRELAAASDDLAAVEAGSQEAASLQRELAAVRQERDQLIASLASVASEETALTRDRAAIAAKRQRLESVRAQLAVLDQALTEWRDLQKSLGKGGLADLEIDAAGPTITAKANTLLAECFDGRFSLELVTQVEKAAGGLKDEFTVRVFDNQQGGAWRELHMLSGGQKTIVQEALMCAIALHVAERSPMPIRTLWRDETGAALSHENALAYVAMLRKVRELGRLHQVYFVSHNREAAALADAQIVVADGTASIQLPPFGQAAAAA